MNLPDYLQFSARACLFPNEVAEWHYRMAMILASRFQINMYIDAFSNWPTRYHKTNIKLK